MNTMQLDHPLPVGTILRATDYDPPLYKVIVGIGRESTGLAEYQTFTPRSGPEKVQTQTRRDLETVVKGDEYPDWEVFHRPD